MRRTGFLLIAVWFAGAEPVPADVTATILDAEAARGLNGPRLGFAAGDVLLANDRLRAVVLAVRDAKDPGRLGRIVLLGGEPSAEPFFYDCGPVNGWTKGEIGQGTSSGVVRFAKNFDEWSAEFAIHLSDRCGWLDLRTTVHNRAALTLEIPVVDVLRGHADCKIARDESTGSVVVGLASATSVGVRPMDGPIVGEQSARGEWQIGFPTENAGPNRIARATQRVFRMGRSEYLAPVVVERSWNAAMKDRRHWRRVPPGASVEVRRRLLAASLGSELPSMLAAAARTPEPRVRLAAPQTFPTETPAPMPPRIATRPQPTERAAAIPVKTDGKSEATKPAPPPKREIETPSELILPPA